MNKRILIGLLLLGVGAGIYLSVTQYRAFPMEGASVYEKTFQEDAAALEAAEQKATER